MELIPWSGALVFHSGCTRGSSQRSLIISPPWRELLLLVLSPVAKLSCWKKLGEMCIRDCSFESSSLKSRGSEAARGREDRLRRLPLVLRCWCTELLLLERTKASRSMLFLRRYGAQKRLRVLVNQFAI